MVIYSSLRLWILITMQVPPLEETVYALQRRERERERGREGDIQTDSKPLIKHLLLRLTGITTNGSVDERMTSNDKTYYLEGQLSKF